MTIVKYSLNKNKGMYALRKEELVIHTKIINNNVIELSYTPKWDIVYTAGDHDFMPFIWDEPELTKWFKKHTSYLKIMDFEKTGNTLVIHAVEIRF